MTVEQFLNKLPTSVVKNGRVIDIRSGLGETLQTDGTKPSKVKLVETEAVQELKSRWVHFETHKKLCMLLCLSSRSSQSRVLRSRMTQEESKRPPSSRDITTLRIKSDQGGQTYILKMKFSQTVGDVKKHLDGLRCVCKHKHKQMYSEVKEIATLPNVTRQSRHQIASERK